METTVRRHSAATPIAKVWDLAKKLDDSQKLELVSIIIDSMKAPSKREPRETLRPYTKKELNAMIDQSERDIAEGRVYDFDEAMDELEKEFAAEDRELEMVEVV